MNEEKEQPNNFTLMPPIYGLSSSIVYMTNPQKEIEKFELMLRGMKPDKEGYYSQLGDPLMNEDGINSLIGFLQNLVNQASIMGNIDEKERNILLLDVSDRITEFLGVNRKKFGIINVSYLGLIHDACLNIAQMTTSRALEGDDKRFWGRVTQDIQMKTSNDNTKKGGFFSKFNPFSKGA